MTYFEEPGNVKTPSPSNEEFLQAAERRLEDISCLLRQMLRLAQTSAGEGEIDRPALQRQLNRLREEIDRLADHLSLPAGGVRRP